MRGRYYGSQIKEEWGGVGGGVKWEKRKQLLGGKCC